MSDGNCGAQLPTFMVFKDGNKVGYTEGVGAGNLHVSESLQLHACKTLLNIFYRN